MKTDAILEPLSSWVPLRVAPLQYCNTETLAEVERYIYKSGANVARCIVPEGVIEMDLDEWYYRGDYEPTGFPGGRRPFGQQPDKLRTLKGHPLDFFEKRRGEFPWFQSDRLISAMKSVWEYFIEKEFRSAVEQGRCRIFARHGSPLRAFIEIPSTTFAHFWAQIDYLEGMAQWRDTEFLCDIHIEDATAFDVPEAFEGPRRPGRPAGANWDDVLILAAERICEGNCPKTLREFSSQVIERYHVAQCRTSLTPQTTENRLRFIFGARDQITQLWSQYQGDETVWQRELFRFLQR
jgi:hypothetical protein